MKTILVPVDFSKSAKAALSFAVRMAEAMKARIVMVTVINSSPSSNKLINWRNLEANMIGTARKDADILIKSVKSQVNITHQSILGFPIQDRLEQFIEENRIDLVVMGSKGATGLKKTFVGSNAAAMIQRSRVPVILIPEKTRSKPLETFLYASDMKSFESEMEAIAQLMTDPDVKIQVLHITATKYSKLKRLELENKLLRYPNAVLHIRKSAGVVKSIETFAEDYKADMIILFTHTVAFYEKLVGKSVTRQFAFKCALPILTFNRSNISNLMGHVQ